MVHLSLTPACGFNNVWCLLYKLHRITVLDTFEPIIQNNTYLYISNNTLYETFNLLYQTSITDNTC